MEETIQKLFSENPYFAFAGFVALVAVCLYVIKKLKNIIIAVLIFIIALGIYCYRVNIISGETISRLFNARSMDDFEELYEDFNDESKETIKKELKKKVIETLQEDL